MRAKSVTVKKTGKVFKVKPIAKTPKYNVFQMAKGTSKKRYV